MAFHSTVIGLVTNSNLITMQSVPERDAQARKLNLKIRCVKKTWDLRVNPIDEYRVSKSV